MTWTKLGDEFGDSAWELSDAAFRTHVDALLWSNRLLLDLVIPKRQLRRFAFSEQAAEATAELVRTGWWKDTGDYWDISPRFPEWQKDRGQIESRRAYLAEAQRRSRAHRRGDHSRCLATCKARRDSTDESTVDPGRDGSGRVKPRSEERTEQVDDW